MNVCANTQFLALTFVSLLKFHVFTGEFESTESFESLQKNP